MPLYSLQTETTNPTQVLGSFPVYQGFTGPATINGVQLGFYTQSSLFFNAFPSIPQSLQVVATGNGTTGPYTIQIPLIGPSTSVNPPYNTLIRGHIDLTGIISTGINEDPPVVSATAALTSIPAMPVTSVLSSVYFTSIDATGANIVVADSGQFLEGNINYGLLMQPGLAPYGNLPLTGGYTTSMNTINYQTGQAVVTFPTAVPSGANISAQCQFYQCGLPRSVLFYNNTLTLRAPPALQYLVELDAYLSPAAFFNTASAIPFGYMAEYIARGAAQKILSDTGDVEQYMFYEPIFREQEMLVWKRSQRQWTSTRTMSIYSQGNNFGMSGFGGVSGGTL